MALLTKLEHDWSLCTISSNDILGEKDPGVQFVVKAEPDEVHYSEENIRRRNALPGEMHPQTEADIKNYEFRDYNG